MTASKDSKFKLTHDPLTPFDTTEEPSPEAVHLLRKELYANSRAIRKDGSNHGHLGIIMPTAEFTTLTGNAYVYPLKPDIPDYANEPDSATRQGFEASYEQQIIDYNTHNDLSTHLLSIMIDAIPRVYIEELEDSIQGFADVTPQAMLAHLIETFGTIEPEDLDANEEKLSTPWDPSTSIHPVFTTAERCKQYSTIGGDTLSEGTITRRLTEVFQNSGVFDIECKQWRNKTAHEKNYVNLKKHFIQANKNRLLVERSLKHTLAANAAKENTPPPTVSTDPPATEYAYCHTHGFCKNLKHTSQTCSFPGPNHQKTATATNKMGGCTTTFSPQQRQQSADAKKKTTERAKLAKEAKAAKAVAAAAAQATLIGEAVKTALTALMAERRDM
jgi:hypothetical protein